MEGNTNTITAFILN